MGAELRLAEYLRRPKSYFYLLSVSRPGGWQVTVWFYLLTLARAPTSPLLLAGLLYCTWPMNCLLYAVNDLEDVSTDLNNPRKRVSGLFGTQLPRRELRAALRVAWLAQPPCLLALFLFSLLQACEDVGLLECVRRAPALWVHNAGFLAVWYALAVAVTVAYNRPPLKLAARPPYDLVAPLGYVLCLPLARFCENPALHDGQNSALGPLTPFALVPWRACVHACLMTWKVQLWTETMDIRADEHVRRRTTAVLLGPELGCALTVGLGMAELQFHNHFLHGSTRVAMVLYSALTLLLIFCGVANAGAHVRYLLTTTILAVWLAAIVVVITEGGFAA